MIYVDLAAGKRTCVASNGATYVIEDVAASETIEFSGAQDGENYRVVVEQGVLSLAWPAGTVHVNDRGTGKAPPAPLEDGPTTFDVFARGGVLRVNRKEEERGAGYRFFAGLLEIGRGVIAPSIQRTPLTVTPSSGTATLRCKAQDRFLVPVSEQTTLTLSGIRDGQALDVFVRATGAAQNVQFAASGMTFVPAPPQFASVSKSLFRIYRNAAEVWVKREDF